MDRWGLDTQLEKVAGSWDGSRGGVDGWVVGSLGVRMIVAMLERCRPNTDLAKHEGCFFLGHHKDTLSLCK